MSSEKITESASWATWPGGGAVFSSEKSTESVSLEDASTVKLLLEVAVWLPTVTEIEPVVAPGGTLTIKVVAVAKATVAGTPLNCTESSEAVVLKPWP